MDVDPAFVGKALAARVADLEAAMARSDAFAYRPDQSAVRAAPLQEDDLRATVRDLTLAALRAASDPVNYAMLRQLADGDTRLDRLAEVAGLSRLATWERLNGLIQVGLVGRSYEDDTAGLSAAGSVLVGLVEGAVDAAAVERGEP